jgi:glycyl-tRNA synthetase
LLAFLCDAYNEEQLDNGETRVVLKLHPALAPYKVAVLPLMKKLREPAEQLYTQLLKKFMVDYDETGSIGRRYRRQDEIGTPYCITIDFDTLEDNTVTVRDRDTMDQIRLKIDDIEDYLEEKTYF